jgi:hypothetical protein
MPRIVSTAERFFPAAAMVCAPVARDAPSIVSARPIRIVRDSETILGVIVRLFNPADLFAPANDAPAPAAESGGHAAGVAVKLGGLDGFITAMVNLLHRDMFGGAQ